MAQEAVSQEVASPAILDMDERMASKAESPLAINIKRLRKKKIAMLALCFIALFYAAGLTAPLLARAGIIQSYTKQDLTQTEQSPSLEHPFGTDRLGRDQLAKVIWSAQTTTIITIASLFTGGLFLAVTLGLLAGYVGGWVDTLIIRVGDVFASLPSLLMLILINATLKPQVRTVFTDFEDLTGIHGIVKSGAPDYFLIAIALAAFGWVGGARIIRSQILALRETEFITAAQATGATTPRILFRHLLPNISNYLIVSLSLALAGIAGSEIVLTWFGVGVQPPHPSFGAMIYEASSVRTINAHLYLLAFPAGVVTILIFSFNLLGDALTDIFTPRAR
jgi:ABC-type dipeptide/oligopeptide/nickel transport system permease subunit